jgi:deoxyribodipyrimidine photo-lyase
MSGRTILVWFRNDLRIHDNEILLEATLKATHIIPVYIFDPRYYTKTDFGNLKTGKFRAKFTLESVADLKQSLKSLGGDLLVFSGKPEELLPKLVKDYHVDEVYHHREVASEETEISSAVEDALWKLQINLKHFIGHTLYHKEDLPFPIKDIPDVFAKFRKKTEREGEIRAVFASPDKITVPDNLPDTTIPDLADLGYETFEDDPRRVLDFKGGESAGMERLNDYLWQSDGFKNFKQKKNGLIGANYSSKLSPWLAAGCVSPREVYWEVKKYERERGASDSTQALIFELLWRDYFRFMFKKHGTQYFVHDEASDKYPHDFAHQKEVFELWKNGKTGLPFIDANMRELNLTGFMSNRGRQNVASYLVNDLQVNWTWGAAYFEEQLIDYSPSTNWGNWAYVAGISNDPKENRHCNIYKQAKDSDPKAEYVKLWLPELADLPADKLLDRNEISLQH